MSEVNLYSLSGACTHCPPCTHVSRNRGTRQVADWQTTSRPLCSVLGSYLRLVDSCITQRKAQGPSRTCNASKEEEHTNPNVCVCVCERESEREREKGGGGEGPDRRGTCSPSECTPNPAGAASRPQPGSPHFLSGIKSSFSNSLICTTSRQIPASATTDQGPQKGDLRLLWGLVVKEPHCVLGLDLPLSCFRDFS